MKKTQKYIITLALLIVTIIFSQNNYFLYDTTILEITTINNVYDLESEIYTQNITGIIKNGTYKDEIYTGTYETSFSGFYQEKLSIGDDIFVTLNKNENSISLITGVKRDSYVYLISFIFIALLVFIADKKGLKTFLSLMINVLLTISCIYFYIKSNYSFNILLLFILLSLLFISLSILLPNGLNKKSIAAITSSIISLIISFLLSYILISFFGQELYYYTTDYVDVVSDYKSVFLTTVLLSGLGAIMDSAITMASSIHELKKQKKDITNEQLKTSGQNISKDIIGTMINVLLYTSFISVIPTIILALKNNMTFFNVIDIYGQIQLVIILTSCISIILSIPISLYTTLYFYRCKND